MSPILYIWLQILSFQALSGFLIIINIAFVPGSHRHKHITCTCPLNTPQVDKICDENDLIGY